MLGGPQCWSGHVLEIEPRFLGQARNVVTLPTALFGMPRTVNENNLWQAQYILEPLQPHITTLYSHFL